jgi:hypothetical protein
MSRPAHLHQKRTLQSHSYCTHVYRIGNGLQECQDGACPTGCYPFWEASFKGPKTIVNEGKVAHHKASSLSIITRPKLFLCNFTSLFIRPRHGLAQISS